jgi:putative ABC transport system substrate-binding protein
MRQGEEFAIDRRLVLAAFGGWLAAGPVAAQDRKIARVGFVGGGVPSDSSTALGGLREGLRMLGYAEPANLRIEARYAEGEAARIQRLIEEIENVGVDVIVAHAFATIGAVRSTRRVPLVYTLSADPVSVGLTSELGKPQNNATGVTLMAAELNGKRMELLNEIAPSCRSVGVLYNSQHGGEHLERAWVGEAAKRLGYEVSYHPASTRSMLDKALASIDSHPPEALLLLSDGFMVVHREAVMAVASAKRLPVIAGWSVFAESGALISYGPRLSDVSRRPAVFVDRILRGAKAADLPIERPTVLELVVNLDAAAKLGLNLPTAVIARADRIVG